MFGGKLIGRVSRRKVTLRFYIHFQSGFRNKINVNINRNLHADIRLACIVHIKFQGNYRN